LMTTNSRGSPAMAGYWMTVRPCSRSGGAITRLSRLAPAKASAREKHLSPVIAGAVIPGTPAAGTGGRLL
jgi:hypothetical protein